MVKKYSYGTFPSQARKFVENIGASKTSTGNQMVIEFLEEWKIKNPGKKLDTFTLNEVMERAYPDYKGTPAKKASDLMTSNPAWWEKASEGIEIEYTLRGKGIANEAYKNIGIKLKWIGKGLTIPSGPLRESLSSLKRANCVVINGKKNIDIENKILR